MPWAVGVGLDYGPDPCAAGGSARHRAVGTRGLRMDERFDRARIGEFFWSAGLHPLSGAPKTACYNAADVRQGRTESGTRHESMKKVLHHISAQFFISLADNACCPRHRAPDRRRACAHPALTPMFALFYVILGRSSPRDACQGQGHVRLERDQDVGCLLMLSAPSAAVVALVGLGRGRTRRPRRICRAPANSQRLRQR